MLFLLIAGYLLTCHAAIHGKVRQLKRDSECGYRGFCIRNFQHAFGNCDYCSCVPGYTGKYCQYEILIGDCLSNPCNHCGTCHHHSNGYFCSCSVGYTGNHCQTEIDCSTNPCHNNGTCVDCDSGYTCTCASGYLGKNCQFNIWCQNSPCLNGGMCTPENNIGYICHCPEGYHGKNCQTEPTSTAKPIIVLDSKKMVDEGTETLQVPCFAEGIPVPNITWQSLSGMLPTNAKQVAHFLVFKNVTTMDTGHFMCTAKNKIGMEIKVINIQVKAKTVKLHTAPVISVSSVVTAYYYTTARLVCNVTGFPYPSITWEHNGAVLNTTSTFLVIEKVTNSTIGFYTCIATNDVGSTRANIQLKALYDKPKIITSPQSSVSDVGQSHNYTCMASGHPEPTIDWQFIPFNMLDPQNITFPPYKMAMNGSLLTLLSMQESGTLVCTARNKFGFDQKTASVIVKKPSPALG